MKSKITVFVAGQEFSLRSEEDEGYVLRVAAQVDAQVRELMEDSRLSLAGAAVLAALNAADRAQKAVDSADHLRHQVREYLEETQKLKGELADARREISRLRGSERR
ncbi:MAG: cell division protein ZapA [Oscillospiraceae bacterium]|nr:cell division protein ZapA [Oscillospiraceae bacterium]